eukprot:1153106-Pelagomonas_calceolata.AAC.2
MHVPSTLLIQSLNKCTWIFLITFFATLPDPGCGYTFFKLNRLFGPKNSPVCDICDSDDIQDEKRVLFRAKRPYTAYSKERLYTGSPGDGHKVDLIGPGKLSAVFLDVRTLLFLHSTISRLSPPPKVP